MAEEPKTCENCGQAIGKIETVHMYRNHILCDECYGRLRKQDEAKTNLNNETIHSTDYAQSKKSWNGFCITAFVLSLLNLPSPEIKMSSDAKILVYVVGLIFFVLSIVFACIGLSQIEENQSMRGKGLGIAAIIISMASAFIFIVF